MVLTSKPEFNPELSTLFSSAKSTASEWVKSIGNKAEEVSTDRFPIFGLVFFVILAIGLAVWYGKRAGLFETAANIRSMTVSKSEANSAYNRNYTQRRGLAAYLDQLKRTGVPESHFALTNFYVYTINAAGLYFPATDGVISPLAARSAVLAGARAFVFDIWPDLTPGAQYGPILQVVEQGSLWRRISINALPFQTVLQGLVQEALEIDSRPGFRDPLFLYLRFRGKPRQQTYSLTASALQAIIERYRLPSSFNNCRSQDTLFSMPITELARKVVIVSNTRAAGNALSDYINVGPRDGIKMERDPFEARGLSNESRDEAILQIKQNLTWIAPLSESPDAESNGWDYAPSQGLGAHFIAYNLWNSNDNLRSMQKEDMFGKYSFKIKPVNLRYFVEYLPNPKSPQDPGWGKGANAGAPTQPPPLRAV